MKTISDSKFKIEEKASRLELFIRFVTTIIYTLILGLISTIISFALIAQWFYILIKGKRHKRLTKLTTNFLDYFLKTYAYLCFVTDERPPFWPKNL